MAHIMIKVFFCFYGNSSKTLPRYLCRCMSSAKYRRSLKSPHFLHFVSVVDQFLQYYIESTLYCSQKLAIFDWALCNSVSFCSKCRENFTHKNIIQYLPTLHDRYKIERLLLGIWRFTVIYYLKPKVLLI